MATQIPTPTQAPNHNTNSIKSAARKLPIKRKTPTQQQPQIQSPIDPIPIINPNPNPILPDPCADPFPNGGSSSAAAYDDYDDDDDFDDQEDEDNFGGGGGSDVTLSAAAGNGGDHLKQAPPFKFHRIWSESDEIRFLQGLLGCWSQGLAFPRDLNIFYDRFSESMPQPYTRSQLSEKLRRLRKKFRIMSGRITRGQDPNRLAPHDRDLLHLCTRLWDPGYASTSPFSAPDPASSGSGGNKRRRPNPRIPAAAARPKVEDSPLPALPAPPTPGPAATSERNLEFSSGKEEDEEDAPAVEKPKLSIHVPVPAHAPVPAASSVVDNTSKGEDIGYVAAKTVLDVFDGSLKELRMTIKDDGPGGNELARRWQEQRLAELDVFARRLRLVLEQTLPN